MILLNNAFEVTLAEGNFFHSSFYNYVCWSTDFVQDLFDRQLKDVKNNHNTLLALTIPFISISFKLKLS